MSQNESSNVTMIREYLKALESGAASEVLRRFFTADARQIELPNRLNPKGGSSDLDLLLLRAEHGRKLMREQHYEIKSVLAQGDNVAIEASWRGTLAVPLGAIVAGTTLHAHFAMFFEFSAGSIRTQRNYDCFEPW
jgi:ketosteroid isomerase-like protein